MAWKSIRKARIRTPVVCLCVPGCLAKLSSNRWGEGTMPQPQGQSMLRRMCGADRQRVEQHGDPERKQGLPTPGGGGKPVLLGNGQEMCAETYACETKRHWPRKKSSAETRHPVFCRGPDRTLHLIHWIQPRGSPSPLQRPNHSERTCPDLASELAFSATTGRKQAGGTCSRGQHLPLERTGGPQVMTH